MTYSLLFKVNNEPWNKGIIIGPKPPLKLKEIWAIRIRIQLSGDVRNLALFNLAIDSKLRACDVSRTSQSLRDDYICGATVCINRPHSHAP